MSRRLFLLTLSCILVLSGYSAADEPAWKAGAASVVVTPEQSMWMAGYASRTKPSEGVLTDLRVKALALEDGDGHRAVLVTSDLISIPRVLREQVSQAVEAKFKLPPAALFLNCSHTHCGPVVRDDLEMSVMYDLPAEQQQRVETYFVTLRDKMVDVVGDAIARLAPARIGYSHARCGFAMNRRLPSKNGFQNSPYPEGPVDHDVPLLRIDSIDGKLIAVMFGYACHNTTTSVMQFNADYAGYAQTELESAHPGVVTLFVLGCGGDQNPYPRGKIEQAQVHGKTLAMAVEAALLPEPTPIRGALKAAYREVDLPFVPVRAEEISEQKKSKDTYDQRRAEFLSHELEKNGKVREAYPYPVQVIQFGKELTLVSLGGEVVVDYSLRLKRELGPGAVWVAGYSNDVMAYIPSERVLQEGGYEGGGAMRYTNLPAPWRPGIEDRIISTVQQLAEPLRGQ